MEKENQDRILISYACGQRDQGPKNTHICSVPIGCSRCGAQAINSKKISALIGTEIYSFSDLCFKKLDRRIDVSRFSPGVKVAIYQEGGLRKKGVITESLHGGKLSVDVNGLNEQWLASITCIALD